MPLTRRSLLFGSATAAFGLATGSCSLIGSGGGKGGVPNSKDVRGALEKLATETGRETFQSVTVYSRTTGRARCPNCTTTRSRA